MSSDASGANDGELNATLIPTSARPDDHRAKSAAVVRRDWRRQTSREDSDDWTADPPPSSRHHRLTLKESANAVSSRLTNLGGPELGGAGNSEQPHKHRLTFLVNVRHFHANRHEDIIFIRSYMFISMETIDVFV